MPSRDNSGYIEIRKAQIAQTADRSLARGKDRSSTGFYFSLANVQLPPNAFISNKFLPPPAPPGPPPGPACTTPLPETSTYTYTVTNAGGTGIFWYDIAMSSTDGSVVVAGTNGAAWISTTGGLTGLTQINPTGTDPTLPPTGEYNGAAVSANGNVIALSPSNMSRKFWVSKDRGVTWTSTLLSASGGQGEACITDDGQTIGVFTANGVYISRNGGTSYTLYSIQVGLGGNRRGLACSCDGKYMIAANQNGGVSLSSDFGFTWATVTALGSKAWFDVDCSVDGRVMILCGFNDYVYISVNYGVTWTQLTSLGTTTWCGVACSSGGRYMAVSNASSSNIKISQDTGATWSDISAVANSPLDMTADGKKIYAGSGDNGTARIINGV